MAPQLFDSSWGLLKVPRSSPLKPNEAKKIDQAVPIMKGQFALEWKNDTVGQMIPLVDTYLKTFVKLIK